MAVSKRLRYEVLRRDNHTCRYCGASAPDVKLTVDHVTPVALGGRDEAANLVTACEPCNSGKTSTTPGAPLVSDVAADALRWAQAVKAASSQMLADLKARQQIHADFEQEWNAWRVEGRKGHTIAPLPAGWRDTVDAFISAGLPWPVLAECITKAMARDKVRAEEKFRYMCGIAWKKVTELQEAARLGLGRPGGPSTDRPADADSGRAARDRLASALLSLMDNELIATEADVEAVTRFGGEGPDPIVGTVEQVLLYLRAEVDGMFWSAVELLEELPDGVGYQAMQVARCNLYDEYGTDFTLAGFADRAMWTAVEMLQVRGDLAYLDQFASEAQAEWFAYADALWDHSDHPFGSGRLDPPARLRWTCEVAKAVRSGHVYPSMCRGHGKHIESCPELAQYRLVHDGQVIRAGFCATHLEWLKERAAATGQELAYRDIKELGDSR